MQKDADTHRKRFLRFLKRRWWTIPLGLFLLAFLLINVVAYNHAWHMTHFTDRAHRTSSPTKIGWWEWTKVIIGGVNIPRPQNKRTPADDGFAFETHTINRTDGGTLEAWKVDAENPTDSIVIMLPGYAGAKHWLLPEVRAWHDLGYDALLIDFRGCGGSTGNSTTIGYREAEDVKATIDYVVANFPDQKIILFGKSMGAAAALRAASLEDLPVEAMVLECPFDKMLTTIKHRFEAMNLPATPFAHLLLFWGGVQHGISPFSHNPVDYARQVDIPTLLIMGDNDLFITEPEGRSVYWNLQGPKEYHVMSETGHGVYYSVNPDKWNETVTSFLDSLKAAE